MIKNMDMENLYGQMDVYIKVNGKMENNMVKVYILIKMVLKEKENGKKEKELNGLKKMRMPRINEILIYFANKIIN